MEKLEWRKDAKELYLPKTIPTKINVPAMNYFTVEGSGNPNSHLFTEMIETLYTLSYTVKMMPKKGVTPEGYYDYTVFPLEGIWDLDEEGRKLDYLSKEHFVYKLTIRQPEFVNEELFQSVIKGVKEKKPNLKLDNVKFETIEEGLCLQMMHLGSYDNEKETFDLMEKFCSENNLKRACLTHKEIYISDARKTPPEKLKTVLRFSVTE